MASSTVSAFTENDTYIDIAKIEGGETYKAYMLGKSQQQDLIQYPYCPLSKQLCQRFWPFTTITNPLAPILHVLVAAAGSLLERTVESAVVSFDAIPYDRWDRAKEDIRSAMDSIHAHTWEPPYRIFPELNWALGMGGRCSAYLTPEEPGYVEDPPKFMLGVEYTRRSLVSSLWEEECGLVWPISEPGIYSRGLGFDAREACLNESPSNNSDVQAHCDDLLKSELRELLRNSSYVTKYKKISAVDAVLVTGERADDEGIKTLLSQVLDELFTDGGSLDLSLARKFSPDPTFAGSRAAAFAERAEKIMKRRRANGDPRDL
jgi:hypothetical protein